MATAPPGSIFGATVDVTVTNGSGTSATSSSDQFTYYGQVPVVTGVSPNAGDASGSVTIAGCNFNNVAAVDFGGVPASAITINSQGLESQGCIPLSGFASGSITVTVPKGPTNGGTVDVTVTTTIATSATSGSDHFTYYAPPTVSAISPNNGTAAGGTAVTITGTNFQSNVNFITVMFGGSPAAKYIVNSDTSITATSPAASIPNTTGTVDIVVSTNNGTSQTSAADKFTYNGTVTTVTGVSPSSGAAAGGNTVTITGTNFTDASAVKFGAVAATVFAVNSATSTARRRSR